MLLSVLTPTFQIGAGIDRALASLLAQTHTDWEWVVLDDSHDDETHRHLSGLLDRPDVAGRLRLHRQVPHSGSIGANKARAASLARGEVLVELDHDDELRPEALAVLAATFARHPDVDFAYSDWVDWLGAEVADPPPVPGRFPVGWGFGFGAYASEVLDGRRVDVALSPPITWQTVRHIVAAPNHVRAWRRSAYERMGGHDPSLAVGDDYDLVVRSVLAGTVARIPRPLYVQHHRRDQGNTSRRRNARIQEVVAALAERHRRALDHRFTELGLGPHDHRAEPWADHLPLPAANATIDVLAEDAAAAGRPLVSVVIPTHRRPELLRRAVASALAQTHQDLEVLVVGDGCPDVDAVVAGIDDARVRHANLAANHADGGASPRNVALKLLARGSLVAYLDDDNTWAPDHLASLVGHLEDPTVSYAFSSFEAKGQVVTCRRPRRFQIDTSALLHRRGLLDHHGYWRKPSDVGYVHDWELVARWAAEPWAASLRPTLRYAFDDERQGPDTWAQVLAVAAEEAAAEAVAR